MNSLIWLDVMYGMTNFFHLPGMTVAQALEIWTGRGRPFVHLGPGEGFTDLEKLLTGSDASEHHLSAARHWLEMGKE
jgi:hypothetical protein